MDHCCKSDAIVIARARRVRKRRGGREPIGRSDVELHCIGRGRRRVRRSAENGEAQTEGRELWPTIARPGVRTLGPYPDHAADDLGDDVRPVIRHGSWPRNSRSNGPSLPMARLVQCPKLAKADVWLDKGWAAFDVVDGARSRHRSVIGWSS